MSTIEQPALWIDTMPDLPGIVHGIKSLSPCVIQCDGCGKTDTGDKIALTAILSDISFNPRVLDSDRRRMCAACWKIAGWVDDVSRGWQHI